MQNNDPYSGKLCFCQVPLMCTACVFTLNKMKLFDMKTLNCNILQVSDFHMLTQLERIHLDLQFKCAGSRVSPKRYCLPGVS